MKKNEKKSCLTIVKFRQNQPVSYAGKMINRFLIYGKGIIFSKSLIS